MNHVKQRGESLKTEVYVELLDMVYYIHVASDEILCLV